MKATTSRRPRRSRAPGAAAPPGPAAGAEGGFAWDDPEMSGAAPPPGSWRGRPPLSLRFGNPAGFFRVMATALAPLAALRHLVLPAVALAGTAMAFNWLELQIQLAAIGLSISFLQAFVLGLLVTNLVAKLVQGTVMAAHGAFSDEIGGRLAFGVIPKFYVFKGPIRSLGLPAQRACYAAPLLFRLAVFSAGILIWIVLRGSGSGITDYAISVGMAGLTSFLFTANPLFPADGYQWLAARLERPRLRQQSFRVLGLVFTFRAMPAGLPRGEFWLLFLFGTGSIAFTAFVLFSVISSIAFLLEAELAGTGVVIFCVILVAVGVFVNSLLGRQRGGRRGRAGGG